MTPLTTYERRQRLLQLLHSQPGIRVVELASSLDVSAGTIRNDLNALTQAGQLTRVRGGAVPIEDAITSNAPFAAQARLNRVAKEQIARWAANLVEDGDAILLDASTTAYHLGKFLQDRRNLTVVTSGLDQIYPRGIPVGRIVGRAMGEGIARRFEMTPLVDFSRIAEVLVLKTEPAVAPGQAGPGGVTSR